MRVTDGGRTHRAHREKRKVDPFVPIVPARVGQLLAWLRITPSEAARRAKVDQRTLSAILKHSGPNRRCRRSYRQGLERLAGFPDGTLGPGNPFVRNPQDLPDIEFAHPTPEPEESWPISGAEIETFAIAARIRPVWWGDIQAGLAPWPPRGIGGWEGGGLELTARRRAAGKPGVLQRQVLDWILVEMCSLSRWQQLLIQRPDERNQPRPPVGPEDAAEFAASMGRVLSLALGPWLAGEKGAFARWDRLDAFLRLLGNPLGIAPGGRAQGRHDKRATPTKPKKRRSK